MATLPEAHAASWRAVGMPLKSACNKPKKPPSRPWPANISPAKLPTWPHSMSRGSSSTAARPAPTVSANAVAVSQPLPGPIVGEIALPAAQNVGHGCLPSRMKLRSAQQACVPLQILCGRAMRQTGPSSMRLAVDQDAFRGAGVLVDDEADEIAVVFLRRADPRRERRLAGVAASGPAHSLGSCRSQGRV